VTPETERRFVALALQKGVVSSQVVERLERERAVASTTGRRRRSLPQALCEEGLLARPSAASILREARARVVGLPSDGPLPTTGSLPANDRDLLAPGTKLGPYEIVDRLGAGGMGVVFRARDARLGREVALKTIAGRADEVAIERFLREGRAAAKLRHPGIVAVHGAEVIDGVRVVVLELVEGRSLHQRIALDGPLPPHDAALLGRDLALAVQAAHDAGIVHRDLKPSNVLLEKDGRPRLTDFGLAKDESEATLTRSNELLGTPQYMAPEQALGASAEIGPSTDVYGLGAVLYEVLAGEPPFGSKKKLELARAIVEDEPESPTRIRQRKKLGPVPPDLETICLKALEKAPERRYASARAMAEDLASFVEGKAILARPPGPIARIRRFFKGPGRPAIAGLLMTIVVLIFVRQRQKTATAAEIENLVTHGLRLALDGRHDKALAEFTRAIALDPSDFRSWKRRAEEHWRGGELDEAVADYGRAIELWHEPACYAARGEVEIDQDRFAEAIKDIELARQLDPTDPYPGALADAYLETGNDVGAINEADTLLARSPERAKGGTLAIRGVAKLHTGDRQGAFADVMRAVELNPTWWFHLYASALVKRDRGDVAGAIADLRSASALVAGTPEPARNQQRIDALLRELRK
jgi:tetratricopeptide (TPR) repeat protein